MQPPFRKLGIVVFGLIAAWAGVAHAQSSARPNIIFVLTDDQGYGDVSCLGNPVLKTPNLDRLHDESVRFTDFHVSPTCSPTRASLMTGGHEFRSGVTHTINERERMALSATTIAQVLKSAGYATGIFGKWHLGDQPEYQPDRRGFDEVFIHGGGGIGQSYPGSCGDVPGNTYFSPTILHNGKFEKTSGYCTDVFFSQAMKWIEATKGKKPFFVYLATNAPHAPLQVPKEYEDMYRDQKGKFFAKFFGMIANIDDNVGRLMAKLKELGIDRDTLVIYMNDNGGTVGAPIFNAGMRGDKCTPWLGGTRALSFWRWPGEFKPADVTALSSAIDVFPTLADLAGAKLSDEVRKQVEGRSLLPLLRNSEAPWPDRVLFTHVGRWPKGKAAESKYLHCAVRNTRWHLVSDEADGARKWQLFDVAADIGEKHNVAAEHPEVVKELDADYDRWWDSIQPDLVNENAIGPKVNPFKEHYLKQFGDKPKNETPAPKPTAHTIRDMEGWRVRVDDRLLQPSNEDLGARAMKVLAAKLADINVVVAPDKLEKLHAVTIVLDLSNGGLTSMQYHPDVDWLVENGYDRTLAHCVHIPVAADLLQPDMVNVQPWCVLHELAHSYHDQILGFDEPRIRAAYEKYKKSGHGDSVLVVTGDHARHYALTDHKEFFAEMSEAYFGSNDFFPFNRAELMTAEPEIYHLLLEIWGPVETEHIKAQRRSQ